MAEVHKTMSTSLSARGLSSAPRRRFVPSLIDALEPRRLLAAGPTPPALGGDPSVNPADFRVTTFASGLNYPTGVVAQQDGSLLVLTNTPRNGGTNFYDSTAQVVRLVDADGDGVADGPPAVLADGLPGAASALALAGNYVIVTSSASNLPSSAGWSTISFLRRGLTPASPLTFAGEIDLQFPAGWEHPTFGLAVRPTPGRPGDFDVAFNIGSQFNGIQKDAGGNILFDTNGVALPEPTTGTVPLGGLISGVPPLTGDGIYLTTLHDAGGVPNLSTPLKIATGLRNAMSMAFDPSTGDLIYADNGIDGLDGGNEAYSTDTLFRLPAAQIGVTLPTSGFPTSYTLTNDLPGQPDRVVNPGGRVTPIASFQPLPDANLPATGSEAEGASALALAPATFPTALRGVFVGFHGKFASGGTANEENPLRFVDPATGRSFDVVSNDEPNIGHIDGATSTADSLFLSDVASTGRIFNDPGTGVIYQVKVANRPPVVTPVPSQSVSAGKSVTIPIQASTPNPGHTLIYALAPGSPATAAIDAATGVFTWTAPAIPGVAAVTVVVTDAQNPSFQQSTSFTINVLPNGPVITLGPVTFRGRAALQLSAIGSVSDPGRKIVKATVSYGDRTATMRLRVSRAGTFTLAHRYRRPGSYVLTIRMTDSAGAVAVQSIPVTAGR